MRIKCRELMSRAPDHCSPCATVQQVGAIMRGRDIGVMPVVDGDKLVGVVTDRDLAISVLGNAAATDQTLIGEIMSTPPISCCDDDDVKVAVELMTMHQIKRVPLVNEFENLVGLISLADIADRLQDPELSRRLIHEIAKSAGDSGELGTA